MKTKKLIIITLLYLIPYTLDAQCAMCRAVVESETDGKTAQGLNNGIVYLMAIPYILVIVLSYIIYKKWKK